MYIVKAMRKNLAPKRDYEITMQWADGQIMGFATREQAEKAAEDFQRDPAHQIYDAKLVPVVMAS